MRVDDAVEHRSDRSLADLEAGLMHRGERHRKQLCIANIVEAGDTNILGDAQAESQHGAHRLGRRPVIRTNQAVDPLLRDRMSECFRVGRIEAEEQIAINLPAMRVQRFAVAHDPTVSTEPFRARKPSRWAP